MNIFISRDLDSCMTVRETAAVKEWLDSDKTFHIMRDHPDHVSNIIAGMWGIKLHDDHVRKSWRAAWEQAIQDKHPSMFTDATKQADQMFLARYVYASSNNYM